MPDLLSLQNASQQALMSGDRVRQAEGHANVAMRWTLATSHARSPETLLRCDSVEPWVVDADAQPAILARMGSCARWAAVPALGSCILQLLSGLGDELLGAGRSSPGVLLRETCCKACIQVVPGRLPRDVGKV